MFKEKLELIHAREEGVRLMNDLIEERKELESQLTSVRQELAAANEKLAEYESATDEKLEMIYGNKLTKLTQANKIMREALEHIEEWSDDDLHIQSYAKRKLAAVDALENGEEKK